MSWNYRVLRTKVTWKVDYEDTTSEEFYYEYEIREVYYDGDGNVEGVTVKPSSPYGNCKEELAEDLELMALALSKPVLELINGKYVEVGSDE
jgi:hypothetical protein